MASGQDRRSGRGFGLVIAVTIVLICAFPYAVRGAEVADSVAPQARAFLDTYCVKCHSGDKPKGDLRLDRLTPDLTSADDFKTWRAVREQIESGEMPPKGKPQPPPEEARALTTWIAHQVHAAELAQREAGGRVVMRRLNREEYENTLHDLLGVRIPLKDLLPPDASLGGFDNVGEALHTSSFLLDRYLDAADAALAVGISNSPRPPSAKKRYLLTETHRIKTTTERVFRASDEGVVTLFSSSPWQAVDLTPFYPRDRGVYRFRIAARGVQSGGKPVTYRVQAGLMESLGKPHLVGYFDAPANRTEVVEFTDYLEPKNTIRILPYGLANAQTVNKVGADGWDGPGLAVEWVEIEGPINDVWPPESHRRIFGGLPQAPAPKRDQSTRVEVTSTDPSTDAARILRAFARRAFRRPVTDSELKPILSLVEQRMAEKYTFEQAVRVGLAAVLVSPDFLFLRERPGRLDDFALASRLSYFLWSSMPDEPLLALAESGKLGDETVLRGQVDRMLRNPKAAAFTENFTGQWLGLRDIDFTTPSHILYPEFDDMLKVSMLRETHLFFEEVLKDDLSLANFVASDFTMLNGRLAKHYGIPGVDGWAFKKTTLPPGSHRGGLLTMASVLKVTANGTSTSPVMRGAWVLDRILGAPTPPPPENVGSIEPDIRGATTIREQLAKHRQLESCASCHVKIDPAGFALESFDVIGGWRDHYRASGNGKPVTIDGRKMPYLHGKPVDPADVLPDGRAFKDIDELKQLLLADKDGLARALTKRLVTYATGAPADSVDQPAVETIVAKARVKDYGFRTLIHEVVQSELFRNK